MLKRSVTATLLLICVTTVTCGVANGQSRDRIEVQIPFSFVVGKRTLPAGKYILERADPGRPNILMLTNVDNRLVRVVIAQRVEKENPGTASTVVFIKREEQLYLYQVWSVGSMNGAQIPSAVDKRSNVRRQQSPTFVTLKVADH